MHGRLHSSKRWQDCHYIPAILENTSETGNLFSWLDEFWVSPQGNFCDNRCKSAGSWTRERSPGLLPATRAVPYQPAKVCHCISCTNLWGNVFSKKWDAISCISIFEFVAAHSCGFEMRVFWSSLYALRKLGVTWKLRLVRWWRCPRLRRAKSELWRLCCSKGIRTDEKGHIFWIVIQEIGTRLSNHPLTQSAMQCSASVHTLHMPKPVVTFVFKVLRNALLGYILYTCPNLW